MPVGFVKTVGILEKTILTLEKTVSTLEFSNVLTVFGASGSGMFQKDSRAYGLRQKDECPAAFAFFISIVIRRKNSFLYPVRNFRATISC